jgi:uncharacterized membrane protein
MSPAHLHLLLNHLPTIGFGIGICLYAAAFFSKNDGMKRATLILLFLVAVLSIPTYLTGNFAELEICAEGRCLEGPALAIIRAHEDAALLAFSFMQLTGFAAWLALWQFRWKPHLPAWNLTAVLLLSLVTFASMAYAANKGGDIRHPEIHGVQNLPSGEDGNVGTAKYIGTVLSGATGIGWLWPGAEAIHFVGLCLLFGPVLFVNLRMLGMAKTLSYASVYQLLPVGMIGFGLNLVTGMLFFIGRPSMYDSGIFYWKVLFIVLGGFNILYYTEFDGAWRIKSGDDAPLFAKVTAVSAIFIWLAVLYCGHMLPFRGSSF